MDKRLMVLLQTSFLREENHTDEALNLSLRVSFQLVHPSLDDQGNAFMGCDCHIEVVFKLWKSELHLATLPTKTQAPTLCYLYGRLLLLVLAYALCPALRTALWTRQQRELSFLKLMRSLQAVADGWLQRLFAPPAMLRALLQQLGLKANRLVTKAASKRRTSAQRLRESVQTQTGDVELTIKLAA